MKILNKIILYIKLALLIIILIIVLLITLPLLIINMVYMFATSHQKMGDTRILKYGDIPRELKWLWNNYKNKKDNKHV